MVWRKEYHHGQITLVLEAKGGPFTDTKSGHVGRLDAQDAVGGIGVPAPIPTSASESPVHYY